MSLHHVAAGGHSIGICYTPSIYKYLKKLKNHAI